MSYTPDTRHRLRAATRFFARLVSFDLECPHCGTVYQVRPNAPIKNWDPTTGRFTCTRKDCGRHYVLGMLAWPVGSGPGAASAPPEDQIPGPRELAQLRREGGGWWMPEEERITAKRPGETNLTTEEERPDREEDEES